MGKVVGINTLFLIPNKVGGTEYHLRSFLNELEKIDKTNSYIIFCNRENYATFSFTNPAWKKVLIPIDAKNGILRIIYEQTIFPFLVNHYHCQLLHSYGYLGPLWGNFKKIVTVHDTNWLDHPEDTSALTNAVLHVLVSGSIITADAIITDSDFSKSRLKHFFPKQYNKVVTVYPGIEDKIKSEIQTQQNSKQSRRYILCVSALYPHKKILYLVSLWKIVSKMFPYHLLVLIGQNGLDEQAVKENVQVLSNVLWLKKISLKELSAYYKHADLFIFPSIYEGFGYPVYEAAYARLPVIVGNKQLYHSSLKNRLFQLTFNLTYDSLKIKLLLKVEKRRSINMNFFNYDRAAQETLAIYENI